MGSGLRPNRATPLPNEDFIYIFNGFTGFGRTSTRGLTNLNFWSSRDHARGNMRIKIYISPSTFLSSNPWHPHVTLVGSFLGQ